jgi:signal transduction histidine kinase
MTVLAVVVVLSWMWMMATSLHFDDARTEVRRPSRRAPQPADLDAALGLRGRLRQRP